MQVDNWIKHKYSSKTRRRMSQLMLWRREPLREFLTSTGWIVFWLHNYICLIDYFSITQISNIKWCLALSHYMRAFPKAQCAFFKKAKVKFLLPRGYRSGIMFFILAPQFVPCVFVIFSHIYQKEIKVFRTSKFGIRFIKPLDLP